MLYLYKYRSTYIYKKENSMGPQKYKEDKKRYFGEILKSFHISSFQICCNLDPSNINIILVLQT